MNKLRLEHTDTELIKILKTSFWNINDQCWTREENWIPLFMKKREISHEKRKLQEQLEKELIENSTIPELKSTKHEYPKVENYWENVWELIEIGTRAIPFTYTKINNYGV